VVIPKPAVPIAGSGAAAVAAAALPALGKLSPSPWLQPSSSASAAVPRIRFDAASGQGSGAPRRMARWLVGPLAVGLMLAAGVGVVHRLMQPDDTIVVSLPRPLANAEPTAAKPQPTVAAAAPAGEVDPASARPQPTLAPASPVPSDQLGVLLDERFGSNQHGWTDDAKGVAWLADGAYHLFARQATRFVAVSVPGTQDLSDVVVSGHFRKTGGPAGGGYGLIVRDQAVAADRADGESQAGPFYVFEIGDKGELGVWLRDADHWVDLLPWTASDAIRPGTEANDLTVSAIGDRLSFLVNGVPVATQLDTVLHHGGVGVFAGGDGNQVTLERLTVRTPR
jgi:hypothetical protein